MTTNKELEAQVRRLAGRLQSYEKLLRSAGMPMPSEISDDPTQQPDYIKHGSEAHLAFLGLVRVDPDEPDQVGYDTRTGKGGIYRLVDPVGPYVGYADPTQAAKIALLQKLAVFEGGVPPVHDKAPPMWVPQDLKPELARIIGR